MRLFLVMFTFSLAITFDNNRLFIRFGHLGVFNINKPGHKENKEATDTFV